MHNHRDFLGLLPEGIGVSVQAAVNVGCFLRFGFKEIGVNDLEILRLDLPPAQRWTVLSEIDELCLAAQA